MTHLASCPHCGRPIALLTERQVEVLTCLARGLTCAEIARELGIDYKTVRVHASRLYAALGVRNQVEATHAAIALGLAEPLEVVRPAVRLSPPTPQVLSPREVQVLTLAAQGKTNVEIAAALNIAEGTAKVHMANISVKLDAADRTHAVATALSKGMIRLDHMADRPEA